MVWRRWPKCARRATARRCGLSWRTPALLAERGFLDSSLMDADTPYELAVGEGSLVEIPIRWALDEWGRAFCPTSPGRA
ncbi:MAG: hypothetical protein U0Q08_08760 [Dermatophilaceae bacterium]